jgi:ERCC4-type nuclease
MKVVVDMREAALLAALPPLLADLSGVVMERAALLVGDVAFFTDTEVAAVLLERKSIDDLASSHRDGRYKEQRARLLAQRGAGTAVGYMLEGSAGSFAAERFTDADLRNAILRLQFRYTIPVIQTTSVADTASYIKSVVVSLLRDPACFRGGLATTAAGAAAAYAEAIHVRKADNSTPDRVVRSMLRVIPGLGPAAVEGVAAAVGASFSRLLLLSEADLAAIPLGKRRLGPALARTVHSVLHLP